MDSLACVAPCKINLFLEVAGRRADGYHLLNTLFLPLADGPKDALSLRFDVEPGIRVSCDNAAAPSNADNLCAKAAQRYFDAAGIAPRLDIALSKRIPIAAGLGGGSSDAAATLLLLQRKFKALDELKLHELAAKTGADVPFFLNPVPSVARGIGDLLEPLPSCAMPSALVVFPRFPTSAAWAYRNLDWAAAKSDQRTLEDAMAALLSGDAKRIAAMTRNDLSHAVRRKFPLIGIIEERLLKAGGLTAQVSGSGSSVFALFSDSGAKAKALEELQDLAESCAIF